MNRRVGNIRSSHSPSDAGVALLEQLSSPLGESIWHEIFVDPAIDEVSRRHADAIARRAKRCFGERPLGSLRFLELASYCHYSGQILQQELGLEATVCDISEAALRYGARRAREAGVEAEAAMLAGDFHDLPFSSGYFDLVFIASAVHHTLSPDALLREALRVLAPGGVLFVFNEPCQRRFCFDVFRGNRRGQQTKFEQHLDERDLLYTVTSMHPFSRPEAMFGVVENSHIPIGTYLDTLSQGAAIEEYEINLEPPIRTFDREVLDRATLGEAELARWISRRLSEEIAEASDLPSDRDRCMGFGLPDKAQIELLAAKTARDVVALPPENEPKRRKIALADLFGGVVQIVARRELGHAERADRRFSREVECLEGVHVDRWVERATGVPVLEPAYPSLQDASEESIAAFMPRDEWRVTSNDAGVKTFLNTASSGSIELPAKGGSGILMIRFFAVAADEGIDRIVIDCGTAKSEHRICQNETHLCRLYVADAPSRIDIRIEREDGAPTERPGAMRISVLQFLRLPANPATAGRRPQ